MTGIREQLNTLMQMMQRNNLQPQQRQALRVPRNGIIEANEDPNGDDEADDRGRPRRQNYNPPNGLKLKIPPFRGSSSPEEYLEWIQNVEKCLNGMNILKKGSARWQHLSLRIMLFYGGKI
jgi:hypothetical protein